MWECETELTDFIKKKLEGKGYQVRKEVRLGRVKIDLIAEGEEPIVGPRGGRGFIDRGTKKIVKGIEVKLDNRRIYDAISRCNRLSYELPQLDELYVAFPKFYDRKDLREVLKQVPLGIILANEKGIEIIPPPWNRKPPSLDGMSLGHSKVSPGQEFTVTIGAANRGGKCAFNVKLEWKPAGPFRKPIGENNRKIVRKLEPGQNVSMPFKVKVKPETIPGPYTFMTRVSADGLEGKTFVVEIPIENQSIE